MTITAAALRSQLRSHAVPGNVAVLQRFFKTGRGEYGEGDRFIGVKVPGIRAVCRDCRDAPESVALELLRSKVHEERLLALLMLVDRFARGDDRTRRRIYDAYLANTAFINNWDLVDASAGQIVGGWLASRSRSPLSRLARSSSVWERRIAMIATFPFLRAGDFETTFAIADLLIADEHDLIHKAIGWMLREVGKKDGEALRRFLASRYRAMPRTALRSAIERFPERERKSYLSGQVRASTEARAAAIAAGSSTKSSVPSNSAPSKR